MQNGLMINDFYSTFYPFFTIIIDLFIEKVVIYINHPTLSFAVVCSFY